MGKYEIEDNENAKDILNNLGSKIKSKVKGSNHNKLVVEVDSSDENDLLKELTNNDVDYSSK